MTSLFHWASGLVTLTLGLLLLVTMPITPFTEQYAREGVPTDASSPSTSA